LTYGETVAVLRANEQKTSVERLALALTYPQADWKPLRWDDEPRLPRWQDRI
jgi:hypothetical protein